MVLNQLWAIGRAVDSCCWKGYKVTSPSQSLMQWIYSYWVPRSTHNSRAAKHPGFLLSLVISIQPRDLCLCLIHGAAITLADACNQEQNTSGKENKETKEKSLRVASLYANHQLQLQFHDLFMLI